MIILKVSRKNDIHTIENELAVVYESIIVEIKEALEHVIWVHKK